MRSTGLVVVALVWCGCGPSVKPDAGTGDGGLFGGGIGGGSGGGTGGAGGGSMGGGGGDVDSGVADSGTPDAGPTERLHFRVVEGDSNTPVANVGVRVEGALGFGDAFTNNNGEVDVDLPGTNTRPFDLTIARRDYGALSIIGITTERPTTLRLDRLLGPAVVGNQAGNVTGRNVDAGQRVVIDSYDFVTTSSVGFYSTSYIVDSALPSPMVAIEVGFDNEVINWVVADGGARSSMRQVDFALPDPAETPTSVPWTATMDTSGIVGTANSIQVFGWKAAPQPESRISWLTSGAASLTRDGGALSGNFTGITGPYAPDRLIIELTDMATWLYRGRVHDVSGPIAFQVKSATALSVGGTKLGDVSATAVGGDTWDAFCITIEPMNARTVVWRACTAPGAPKTISKLPDLAGGSFPSGVGIASAGSMLGALPLLIDFVDGGRPWLMANTVGPEDSNTATLGGQYTTITGAWR
ncbi:MAG: hypothetical protein QM817_38280 [Archangium sp.]